MKKTIIIGQRVAKEDVRPGEVSQLIDVNVDIEELIESRLLIQANSGGGKSHTGRRLFELTHGMVQHVIIDPEGEYSTLRSKYDYLLVGAGGDIPADPRTAALLAPKILELGVSTIIDLYELPKPERKRYVRLFLEALVNVDKKLWKKLVVAIDEAHVFCPENDEAESADAVGDLMSRGRKRGFSGWLFTQRAAKLSKDASAECNNKLIGRSTQDVDRKRAAQELGFTSRDQELSLRRLKKGDFYAFGPAITEDVELVHVGECETRPPVTGSRMTVTKPTAAIRKLLSKLADLPQEAEEEARTSAELKEKVKSLEHELRTAKAQLDADDLTKTATFVRCAEEKAKEILKPHLAAFESERGAWKAKVAEWRKYAKAVKGILTQVKGRVDEFVEAAEPSDDLHIPHDFKFQMPSAPPLIYKGPKLPSEALLPGKITNFDGGEKPLAKTARVMAAIVNARPGLTRAQLALHAGLSFPSGNFTNRLSELRSAGMIEDQNGGIMPLRIYDQWALVPKPEEVIEMWRRKLPGKAREMLNTLYQLGKDVVISRGELAQAVGLVFPSGNFTNRLSELRAPGLIEDVKGGVRISPNFFF